MRTFYNVAMVTIVIIYIFRELFGEVDMDYAEMLRDVLPIIILYGFELIVLAINNVKIHINVKIQGENNE